MAGGAVVGAGNLDGPLGDACRPLRARLAAIEAEADQLRTALRALEHYARRLAASRPDTDTLDRCDPPCGGSGVPRPAAPHPPLPDPHAAPKDSGARIPIPVRVTLTSGKTGNAANAPLRARAFQLYRSLGDSRSLRRVSAELGIAVTTLQKWSRREGWSRRANLPEEGTGSVPVEDSPAGYGGRTSRNAADPAFSLPLDEVAVELCNALEERGALTDREFVGHCRDSNLFADATDAAIALAFSNVVHDEPKMFRRRKGVVELVK